MESLIQSINNLTLTLKDKKEIEDVIKNINKLHISTSNKELTFIDLFCGIGGFHIAMNNIKEIKSKCIMACDIDKKCQETYKLNFGINVEKDIKKLDVSKYQTPDIIFAGFPCQSHSVAGKRLGLNDLRGSLIYDLFNIINQIKPKICVLENVKGIKSVQGGKVFKLIYDISKEIGYEVINKLTNPIDINIPQNREREIFILIRSEYYIIDVGIRIMKEYDTLIKQRNIKNSNYKVIDDKPNKIKYIDVEMEYAIDIWNNLLIKLVGKKYSVIVPDYFKEKKSDKNKKWINNLISKMNDIYNDNKNVIDKWLNTYKNKFDKLKKTYKTLEWYVGETFKLTTNIFDYYIQIRQSGIRVKNNKIFPTLVKSGVPLIINKRYITPKECCKLQSFPENYKFISDNHAYKQLGNSINVEIMEIVIRAILMGLKLI